MDYEFWQELKRKNALSASTSDSNDAVKGKPLPPKQNKQEHSTGEAHHSDLYHAVPTELKALRQWVVWKKEERGGKPTKIPYQLNGRNAQSNQANTWEDYPAVCEHRDNFSGIGFVFTKDDPYCGIDLDNCIDSQGNLKSWAKPIVSRLKPVAYGEVSPSGKGIKFWTKAHLPQLAKHKAYISEATGEAIEAYDTGRYFTVTGKGKGEIGDGQSVVNWLVAEHLNTKTRESHATTRSAATSNLSTDEVIKKIRQSKQFAKFDALMEGNTTGHGSQSEADLALCSVIAFWAQDPSTIDAIFRQSKLMRAKWDEQHRGDKATYGQMTIEEALSGNRETYKPKSYRNIKRDSGGYRNVKATWR